MDIIQPFGARMRQIISSRLDVVCPTNGMKSEELYRYPQVYQPGA